MSALRDEFHLPGMRVLQFAFDGHADNPYLPDNYVPNTVVYTGTHDNPTTRGWYEELPDAAAAEPVELPRSARRGTSAEAAPALMGLAWSSVAALAIAPLQDVLNLGKEARMNLPGPGRRQLALALHRGDAVRVGLRVAARPDSAASATPRRRSDGGRIMTPAPIVFLVDVDNTLLDNDRIQDDLKRHLEREFGAACS